MSSTPVLSFNEMLEEIAEIEAPSFDLESTEGAYSEFPVSEYERRYARTQRLMDSADLDGLLLTQDLNVRYLTGYLTILWISRFRPNVAVIPRDPGLGPGLIVPWQETGNATETSWVPDVRIYSDQEDPIPQIAAVLKDKGLDGGRIGTELGFGQRLGMTMEQFEALKREVAPATLVSGTPVLQSLRMLKSRREVERIRKACEISQSAVQKGWEALRPGMTEKELGRVFGTAMYDAGAELGHQPSFFAINSGPSRYRMPNALASDYELREGDLVMIDGGASHGGYSTDFIRQASVGTPTEDQRRWFQIAVEANDAAIAAIRPGVEAAEIYEAGIGVFEREGLLEFNQINIVGHGTGMELHELPWLGEREVVYTSDVVLREGMVLCVEPAIGGMEGPDWHAGCFIVEDILHVTEDGHENLTSALSKELWIQPV